MATWSWKFSSSKASRQRLHPVDRRREFTASPGALTRSLFAPLSEVWQERRRAHLYIYGGIKTSRHLPNDILRNCTASSTLFEDHLRVRRAPPSSARLAYLEGLYAVLFTCCFDYAEDGSIRGTARIRRVAFSRACWPPVLRREHAAGRRVQRGGGTGQLLDHEGVGGAMRNAAHLQRRPLFLRVTNGTSTSNKMVWHHTVAPDDVVVVDRNCHKSRCNAIIMTGAISGVLKPTRNHGITGRFPRASSSPRPSAPLRSAPTRCSRAWMPGAPAGDDADVSTYDAPCPPRRSSRCSDGYVDNLYFGRGPGCRTPPSNSFYGTYHAMARRARRGPRRVV